MKLLESLKKIKEIKIEKKMIIKLVLLAIISIIIAVVFEFYGYEQILRPWKNNIYVNVNPSFNTNYVIHHSIIRIIIFVLFNFFIFLHFVIKPKKIYLFICDNRYKIALVFLAIVTILGLNGSSMSRVGYYYIEPDGETHDIYEILGMDRFLRSDEFGCQSMYIASQQYNNYALKQICLQYIIHLLRVLLFLEDHFK